MLFHIDGNLNKLFDTCGCSLLQIFKVKFRRLPGRKSLSEIDGLSFDSKRGHDSPYSGLVKACESVCFGDGTFHIQLINHFIELKRWTIINNGVLQCVRHRFVRREKAGWVTS